VTEQVREWLPYGVVTDDTVRLAVEDALTRWHDRWFVGPYASVSDMTAAREAAWSDSDDGGWRIHGAMVGVRIRRQALSRMVDKVLDTNSEGLSLTEADRHVMKGLERKIVETLAIDVEQAFGLTGELKAAPEKQRDALAENGGLLVVLKDPAGREILTLGLPTAITLPILKGRLGPPAPRKEGLQPLTGALGPASVGVEAVVGSVELTLTELSNLGVGDVLVLDRVVDEPVDIASAVSHRIFARARLSQVQDGIALVF
jgi:flagellar motor switch/type III secretory pathway protein FliN